MKNSFTTAVSGAALLLTSELTLAHSGHSSDLFHTHESTALMGLGAAAFIAAGAFAIYKLVSPKKAPAKIKHK